MRSIEIYGAMQTHLELPLDLVSKDFVSFDVLDMVEVGPFVGHDLLPPDGDQARVVLFNQQALDASGMA
jgi:hypothetical protein